MKQELIWIPPARDTGAMAKRVPPIPYDGPVPDRLWTLYLHCNENEKPELPYKPVHHQNAFIEDMVHDWNVRNGHLRYFSRAMEGECWVLMEFKEKK